MQLFQFCYDLFVGTIVYVRTGDQILEFIVAGPLDATGIHHLLERQPPLPDPLLIE